MTKQYGSSRSKKTLPKYQSTESGSLKMMHQHKILTYMSFVCLIEDKQVSEQEGEESGTHQGAKDGSRRKRPRDVEVMIGV
jgi:hypothetical protein